MTDAGLVAAFDERVESAWLASQVMTELKSRHSTRLSAMAAAVHALRTEPQRLSQRVAASEAASRGSAGCSMPNLTPAPYDGRPELDLLGLLISRGELDEPRAWANDAGVPDELREALRVRLAKRP